MDKKFYKEVLSATKWNMNFMIPNTRDLYFQAPFKDINSKSLRIRRVTIIPSTWRIVKYRKSEKRIEVENEWTYFLNFTKYGKYLLIICSTLVRGKIFFFAERRISIVRNTKGEKSKRGWEASPWGKKESVDGLKGGGDGGSTPLYKPNS